MPDTLLLDTETWDLCVNARGDIAMASEPYALAQDAASFIRLFKGELYYDTTQGIPYWETILGYYVPLTLVKSFLSQAAKDVPHVIAARSYLSMLSDRIVRGQVQITDRAGVVIAMNF